MSCNDRELEWRKTGCVQLVWRERGREKLEIGREKMGCVRSAKVGVGKQAGARAYKSVRKAGGGVEEESGALEAVVLMSESIRRASVEVSGGVGQTPRKLSHGDGRESGRPGGRKIVRCVLREAGWSSKEGADSEQVVEREPFLQHEPPADTLLLPELVIHQQLR